VSGIIDFALKQSRRDWWTAADDREPIYIPEMNPHHCFNTVRRLRREAADHPDYQSFASRITVDAWLSNFVPAFDALLARLEVPYVKQYLLEGPHRAYDYIGVRWGDEKRPVRPNPELTVKGPIRRLHPSQFTFHPRHDPWEDQA